MHAHALSGVHCEGNANIARALPNCTSHDTQGAEFWDGRGLYLFPTTSSQPSWIEKTKIQHFRSRALNYHAGLVCNIFRIFPKQRLR